MTRIIRLSPLAGLLLTSLSIACAEDPVSAPIIASVQLGQTTALSMEPGDTQQLTARAIDVGGNVIPTVIFSWSSSAETVATVSNLGVVTAVAPGNARITVRAGSQTANIDVEVTAAAAATTAEDTGASLARATN